MSVPKTMQDKYDEISAILIPYCDEHLSEEYKELCLKALEKLCRKRPSPLSSGRANTWAAGIVYAIGSNNWIFDRSQDIHMTASELVAPFGLSKNTVASKAAEIKKMLKIGLSNAEWSLPSMMDTNPMIWTVSVDGFLLDARYLPLQLQILCYQKGLIPYVPALKKAEQKANEES
ncbi:MAG: hypothetical protein IJ083_05925 [Clostridia bacterium]|nr:hypothetical protein [Clostridia bacterium]